jgi:hypothetical protein
MGELLNRAVRKGESGSLVRKTIMYEKRAFYRVIYEETLPSYMSWIGYDHGKMRIGIPYSAAATSLDVHASSPSQHKFFGVVFHPTFAANQLEPIENNGCFVVVG